MSFQIPAYLTGFSSKSDGGAGIRFSTNELSETDFAELKRNLNNFGWMAFSPNEFKESDLPKEIAEDKNKTPSKRLRAVLFLLSKQLQVENFDTFYASEMEKIIDHYKKKLDE